VSLLNCLRLTYQLQIVSSSLELPIIDGVCLDSHILPPVQHGQLRELHQIQHALRNLADPIFALSEEKHPDLARQVHPDGIAGKDASAL
jgi:hypothetical protein